MTASTLDAPFPWFGGKRRVAAEVWRRFGAVKNYVEPFFGSGAVLLARPQGLMPAAVIETINDLDSYVANFWRAIQRDPETVARWADEPVNECDLHAKHVWLIERKQDLQAQVSGDPDYYDARIAGYWVWGLAVWIGSGFCSGKGPWWIDADRKLVHLGGAGQGVNRTRVHLGEWFEALAQRLRCVRVTSGDWSRVCGPSPTHKLGMTGVFLDPPYADTAKRHPSLYLHDSFTVAHDVRAWAIENGENPRIRIALCDYEGEHETPESWSCHAWKAQGGFATQSRTREDTGANARRERIWFSPHCLTPEETREDCGT